MKTPEQHRAELIELCKSPAWRLSHLYKIVDKHGKVVTFVPNAVQERLFRDLHTRNVIPKARQRGLSTAIQILLLDSALFTSNFKGKVIAQDLDVANEIFRDKFKFAYNNLPELIRLSLPLVRESASELVFANGSSVSVTTSARSSTVNMLHVSEMGKIAAKTPHKAREIMTGAIPAVPADGIVFIESTAEGEGGEFFDIVQRAIQLKQAGARLTHLDFKLHFFSWWDADEYRIDPTEVLVTPKDHDYFNTLQHRLGRQIDAHQRAWYVKTRQHLGGGPSRMWQEYPSTVEECFQQSTEGAYYTEQMAKVREEQRICSIPYDPAYPVSTFWDIGGGRVDATAVWLCQFVGHWIHVIGFIEAYGEPYGYFVNKLKEYRYVWEAHYLPHDATHPRQQGLQNKTPQQMIEELAPGWHTVIIPRTPEIMQGINQTRDIFPRVKFDATACAEGIPHLDNYRKSWDQQRSIWLATPCHDEHSHCADAFRQIGQAIAGNRITSQARRSAKPMARVQHAYA